jgi:general secretion pathway protein J
MAIPLQRRAARGFTLVEVLVALFVMAIMAALAWQGVDAVLKSRDAGRAAVDRTALLNTLLSQWETDLQSLHDNAGVPTLSFDGRHLRLVRRIDDGVQLVVWSLSGNNWMRWTSATTTRAGELQQAWLRSQQLQDNDPAQLRLLEGVDSWQVYFFRGNAWTNAQSTGDLAAAPTGAAPPGQAGADGKVDGKDDDKSDGKADAAGRAPPTEVLPTGVRLVLQLGGKTLTRDLMVAPGT